MSLRVNINDTQGIIAERVDLLFEKRKAVREAALRVLHATLSLRYCGDALESRHETLADGLERVLKDHQLEPTLLALHTASAASLSLLSDHRGFMLKLSDPVQKLLADATMPLLIRVEALHTLAAMCYMSSTFDADHELAFTMSTFHLFLDYLLKSNSPALTRAALQGVLLLASSLPSDIQHEELFDKHFSEIVDLMDEEQDIALRVCAAKAATVLLEWEKDFKDEDSIADAYEDVGLIIDQISAVLDDKAKFKNRTDVQKQRGTLKALISYLQGGPVEEDPIVVRNYALHLQTWGQRFCMDRFRAYLGEGFMTHLEENKNLMRIFDYFIDIKAPVIPLMTKQQRRMSLSEASKIATKARGTLRAIREQEMGYATD